VAIWSRLESFIFGGAVARAGSEAVTPVLEPVRQQAWKRNALRVLGIGQLAELAAKGIAPESALADEASRSGYDTNRLHALTAAAQSFPDVGSLPELSNRGLLTPALIEKALSRHGIPGEYHKPITDAFAEILTPGELAAAIHRGLVPDPGGLLKGEQPEPPFTVEAYPVYPIETEKEAAGSGYNLERLGVLVGLQGLPMGTHEAAQAYYKGIITRGDYIRAFNESNSRNEWAQAVLDNTRQIPTSRDFFENALRGHHTFEWAAQQAARHGMSADDALVIYQNQGRPLNLHQISQGLAWGANYKPAPTDDPDPWMQSVLLGPVRPEYYELQHSLKYIVPSGFNLRALQQAGALTPDEAFTWYKRLGWEPTLARKVADVYGKASSAATKEATAGDVATLYDSGRVTHAQAMAELTALGYPAAEATKKLELPDARRAASAKTTAVGDLHAVYKKGGLNDPQALAALEAIGLPDWASANIVQAWRAAYDATNPTPAV
jgi:hypothetical protein